MPAAQLLPFITFIFGSSGPVALEAPNLSKINPQWA